MDIVTAKSVAGSLGTPSKMPGYSYGLPAGADCGVGSKLLEINGSVCHKCYALKGFYKYPNVAQAQQFRLKAITNPLWVDTMVALLYYKIDPKVPYFRWHDSGDIQNLDHLLKIVEVARRTKYIRHWLPTREFRVVREYYEKFAALHPSNLVIRVSSPLIDMGRLSEFKHTSTVTSDKKKATCPSFNQGNRCNDCRRCWDGRVRNIAYLKH